VSQLLLPVGQPLGVFVEVTDLTEPAGGAVRVADDFLDLSPEQYSMWLLSFVHNSRPTLAEATAQRNPGTEAGAITAELDSLIKLGVLLDADAEEDMANLLSAYCVIPTGFGLGASTKRPGFFEIGGPDFQTRAQIEFDVYLVWAAANRASIWQTCKMLAQEHGVAPEVLGRHVLLNLPVLIGSGCAFLDEAP
jgi:hypothetical protein